MTEQHTRQSLFELYEATTIEARDVLDRVADNGFVTLKPGSPALAIFYAYDEVIAGVNATLVQKEALMRELANA